MRTTRTSLAAILAMACLGNSAVLAAAAAPYAAPGPLREPTIFAPGVISTGDHESHIAFTPDGKEAYFLKNAPGFDFWTIFVSTWHDGRWSEPKLAPFASGRYKDADPFITADGKHLFFISDRPVPGKAHRDLDIWTADRVGAHWSEPRNLGSPVNSEGQEWYPTVAADGTLYFGSDRPGGKGKTDIYRARFVDGKYAAPENLGDAINTTGDEYEPFLAPDGRTLFFMADNREGRGDSDIFVSWLCDGVWTKSEPLGGGVNSPGNEYAPKISPDGKSFFWSSTRSTMRWLADKTFDTQAYLAAIRGPGNGLGDIYQIDLDALNLQPKCGKTEKN